MKDFFFGNLVARPQPMALLHWFRVLLFFYRLIELQCTMPFSFSVSILCFFSVSLNLCTVTCIPLSQKLVQLHVMCAVHCVRNQLFLAQHHLCHGVAFFSFFFCFIPVNWCFGLFFHLPILFSNMLWRCLNWDC